MKKIFLLGASGQLGKEWQAFFAHGSEDFVVMPYTSSQLDITDAEKVEHEFNEQQPDIIINCAAYTKVDKAEDERAKAEQVNAEAVKYLAVLCKKGNAKLIHFSTDYVFSGLKEDKKQFPGGYPEDHTADPVNWYGMTKWKGEQTIRSSGCSHLILRVSWLCGEYGQNFVTTMLRLAQDRDEVSVVADQVGSPTFTDNLVRNTFTLIEEKKEGTYHLTSDGQISWADFASAIFDITNADVKVNRIISREYPTAAKRPFFSKLNCDKIKQIPGIETEHWEKGLSRLINRLNQQ